MKEFKPSLIVEVTAVCDRQCVGCYAPNAVSKDAPENIYRQHPEWFLSASDLSTSLQRIRNVFGRPLSVLAMRGGEPSRHPFLSDLIQVAHEAASEVYVETHGRWIGSELSENSILETSRRLGTILKLSFDHMHGLNESELAQIVHRLDHLGVNWCVAITESTEALAFASAAQCNWLPQEKIIFQMKATSGLKLVRPELGVVHCDGTHSASLTTRLSFQRSANLEAVINESL